MSCYLLGNSPGCPPSAKLCVGSALPFSIHFILMKVSLPVQRLLRSSQLFLQFDIDLVRRQLAIVPVLEVFRIDLIFVFDDLLFFADRVVTDADLICDCVTALLTWCRILHDVCSCSLPFLRLFLFDLFQSLD